MIKFPVLFFCAGKSEMMYVAYRKKVKRAQKLRKI